jgi:hypothetical protein
MKMKTEKYYKIKDLPFNKVIFWSYDFDKSELSLFLIMISVIEKGDLGDLFMLFKIFSFQELHETYFNEIRPMLSGEDKKYYKFRPDMKPDMKSVRLMDMIFKAIKEIKGRQINIINKSNLNVA